MDIILKIYLSNVAVCLSINFLTSPTFFVQIAVVDGFCQCCVVCFSEPSRSAMVRATLKFCRRREQRFMRAIANFSNA